MDHNVYVAEVVGLRAPSPELRRKAQLLRDMCVRVSADMEYAWLERNCELPLDTSLLEAAHGATSRPPIVSWGARTNKLLSSGSTTDQSLVDEPVKADSKCRILLADDHDVVLEGLQRILDQPGLEIVGTVRDGRALLEAVEILDPDVIVVDVAMPVLNGIEAVRRIRTRNKTVKIVFLTMHEEVAYVTEALAAGKCAYVLKTSASVELVTAVQEVFQGRTFVSGAIAELVRGIADRDMPAVGLTARKREILQLLAKGNSIKEIAGLLRISPRTVEFHKYRIMELIGARNVADLAVYAIRLGLVM